MYVLKLIDENKKLPKKVLVRDNEGLLYFTIDYLCNPKTGQTLEKDYKTWGYNSIGCALYSIVNKYYKIAMAGLFNEKGYTVS